MDDIAPPPTTPVSDEDLWARSRAVIAGGVNSPVRAFDAVGGTPRFLSRGRAGHVVDSQGRELVDLVNSWGPLILGHTHPDVVAAAIEAVRSGSTFGAPTVGEIELAELVVDAVPSIERVRMVSSGTEAAMSAIRLARGATGRTKILKFIGHYHGHSDALLVDAGSGVATLGIPGSPGVTPGAVADTVLVDFNDPDAVRAAVDLHADDLAVIAVEPFAANMNLVPPDDGFLQLLRDEADRVGALLLFDEVITGFRVARGGAQELTGVLPDVTALGKVVGGGFPLAAFGGSAAVMAHLAPDGPVYQAGTLSGNPVAVAAGAAQLRLLTEDVYRDLEATTTRLADGLADAVGDHAVVTRAGTLAGIVFGVDAPPRRFADVAAADHEAYARFFHGMLDRGVQLAPSGYEVLFTSTALTDDDVDRVVSAAADTVATW
ncbi:glutamate-1-semialdehyde 2,1-aminomutase [Salsipaludibacter albus]|uniref:glutamate-1-semialdehyde 2,1-aminomutase n=1 Tax=Salsipaludibacter albus TaxID=2849650 RepID=UPI001EE43FC4|nr:glutamate-1-semialdehyde 2,1-aminomutase [Salsipaludibacter albus]MBY5161089.1 glutamate-1-semialdehyde 2,1-aminomutase [Salsipaludibacter albus]